MGSAIIAAVSQAQVTKSTSAGNSGIEKNRQCLQICSLDQKKKEKKIWKKESLIPKYKSETWSEPQCSLKVWVLMEFAKTFGEKKTHSQTSTFIFQSFLSK